MSRLVLDYIPLDRIDVSISNARKANLQEGITDLASSISKIGVQQPVVVVRKGDRYELIIGQRRYLACKELGLGEIPAIITSVRSDTDALIKSFSENIHRLDLEYRDKMQVANELLSKLDSVDEVAKHLGVSPQTVRNYLGYTAVPEVIKRMVDEDKLSASTALRIAKGIPDESLAVRIAEKINETPRSEERRNIIDIARENPHEEVATIVKAARERSMMKRITIHVTETIYEAITLASREYQSEKEDIVKDAILDWLTTRGFLK